MKKNLGLILLTCLIFYNSSFASTHTNRTFLMPRPVSENMVLRYSMWHNQIDNTKYTKRGTTFQVSPFYQHSTDKSDIGKYFGYYAPEEGSIRDYIHVVNVEDFADVGDNTWASYLVHFLENQTQNLSGKMKFKPYQEIYGVHVDYNENLDTLSSRLFYEFSIPVVEVKNNLDFSPMDDLTPITLPNHPSVGKTLQDYFKGNVFNMIEGGAPVAGMQQKPLENAKIDGSRSRTDFADITIKLGYRLIDRRSWGLNLSGYCTVPTGNSPTGEYLFEPVCGNGGSWFLGLGPDVKVNFWENGKNSVDLFSSLKLSYGLQNTQKRTFGFKSDDGTSVPFSQYYLVGELGVRHLFPFANVSTLDLKIEPRWQFEALINLDFKLSDFHIAVGYDFFAKEKESVFLKRSWEDNIYAIASVEGGNYSTDPDKSFLYTDQGVVALNPDVDNQVFGQQQYIQENNLDFNSVSTPSQTTHKIYASVGYLTKWSNPFLIVVGGAYEFSDSNSAFSNYSFWSNISLAF